VRVLGIQVSSPADVLERAVDDAGAALRLARSAPDQLERLLGIGDQIVLIGQRLLDLGERLDRRAESLVTLGDQLDRRAESLSALGVALDKRAQEIVALGVLLDKRAGELLATGGEMHDLGDQIYSRGGEIVDRAGQVVSTGERLIVALPTLERALELATPLEGAIDRVGRFVDRLPGGPASRRRGEPPADGPAGE
jgi:hypothetical protein